MTDYNILFIMPDQLRPDFLSCYGADFIDTPHIDSLAQQGMLYENQMLFQGEKGFSFQ